MVLIITLTLVLFVVIVLSALNREPVRIVEIAAVERGNLFSIVEVRGVVRPETEVSISSPVVGTVEEIAVSEGQQVQQGDLLLRLRQQEFEASVRRAQAALELTLAARNQSRTQYERAKELYQAELISREEFESALTQVQMDDARVKEASAALDEARRQLEFTVFTAPITGTVTRINIEIGEQVIVGTLNIPETILMVVSDLSSMQIHCDIDEADIARIAIEQPAVIEIEAFVEQTFDGTVTEVGTAPVFDTEASPDPEGFVVYRVTVGILDTIEGLRTGMTAYVAIVTAQGNDVLMVPVEAVLARPAGQIETLQPHPDDRQTEAVFIYHNAIAHLVEVITGIAGMEHVEITEGLTEGQAVITAPFAALRELQNGDQVRLAQ